MAGASWGSVATGKAGGHGRDLARIGPPLMAPCSPHSSQSLPSAPEELPPRPSLPQVSKELGGLQGGQGKGAWEVAWGESGCWQALQPQILALCTPRAPTQPRAHPITQPLSPPGPRRRCRRHPQPLGHRRAALGCFPRSYPAFLAAAPRLGRPNQFGEGLWGGCRGVGWQGRDLVRPRLRAGCHLGARGGGCGVSPLAPRPVPGCPRPPSPPPRCGFGRFCLPSFPSPLSRGCFPSPNREARWPRAPPVPAAFGRGPGRPLAPAALPLPPSPPLLFICFGGTLLGPSLPQNHPEVAGAEHPAAGVPLEAPGPQSCGEGRSLPWILPRLAPLALGSSDEAKAPSSTRA